MLVIKADILGPLVHMRMSNCLEARDNLILVCNHEQQVADVVDCVMPRNFIGYVLLCSGNQQRHRNKGEWSPPGKKFRGQSGCVF